MEQLKLGDVLNSINFKKGLFDEDEVKPAYVPYVINRTLSYFMDTVMFANEMNRAPHDTPAYHQYLFYRHGIRKGKRFTKWHKPETSKYLELIQEYYNFSEDKAKKALELLTDEQIEIIKRKLDKGGRK